MPEWRTNILTLLFCYMCTVASDPCGHLKPFGQHTIPHSIDVLSEFPIPVDFYEKYQKPGKPVLFKSILKTSEFPPFRLWTDDYMKQHFGHLVVQVEAGKKETRSGTMFEKTLREFLEDYKKKDIYLVQDILESMFGDMRIPRSMQCGGFQDVMETIVIWFSSGGTKSVVHSDTQENINCLLDGTKHLVLADRKYGYLIEADGFNPDGGFSSLDMDKVDMDKYPRIQELPTFNASMEAGDCMYIPYGWYHQVNSFGKRNIAVNFWSAHVHWFNYSNCENVDLTQQTVPFTNYGFIEISRKENLYLFDDLLTMQNVTKEGFVKILVDPKANNKDEIWKYVDSNGDELLTWEEMSRVDARDMIDKFGKSLVLSATFFSDVEEAMFHHEDITEILHGETPDKDEL